MKAVKICCISDTHSQNLTTKWDWPEGDILIHAGDMTARGTANSVSLFGRWLHQLPYRYKVVVAGNHDRCFWEDDIEAKPFWKPTTGDRKFKGYTDAWKLLPGVIVLQDEYVKLLGIKIYGSSWIKFRHGKYPFETTGLSEKWDLIPNNTDVLVTHMPPHGILDVNSHGENKGSHSLRDAVANRVKPKLHVFGHIHPGYGQYVENDTLYVNAALTGDDRKPKNNPIVVEL